MNDVGWMRKLVLLLLTISTLFTGNKNLAFATYALTTAAKYERKEKPGPRRKARYDWTRIPPKVRQIVLNRIILRAHWKTDCVLEFSRCDKDTYQVHGARSLNKEPNHDEIFIVTVDLPVPS